MTIKHDTTGGFENAIYAVYLTGKVGTSLALFLFKDGTISGADEGGGLYDGEYNNALDQKQIFGKIKCTLPPRTQTITGVSSPERFLAYDVPIKFPVEIDPRKVYLIETPIGPVNAKFKKLRSI